MNHQDPLVSIEEQIRNEERLIKLYEAELAALGQAQRGREEWNRTTASQPLHRLGLPTTPGGGGSTIVDAILWSLFPDDQWRLPLSFHEAVDSDVLSLQASLLGFQFTDITRLSKSDHEELSYEFRGFFVDYRRLGAILRMDFPRKDERTTTESETEHLDGPSALGTARMIRVQCKVNCSWMQAEMTKCYYPVTEGDFVETTDVSTWIQQIVSYLEFDARRHEFLQQHPTIAVQQQNGSTVTIQLPLLKPDSPYHRTSTSGQDQDIPKLSLHWGWSWKAGEDTLRMVESRPAIPGLSAHGLEMLVAIRSCPGALILLLDHPKSVSDSAPLSRRSVAAPESIAGETERDANVKTVDPREDEAETLSEYELLRLERIKRNEAFLEKLGLGQSKFYPKRKRKLR